MQSFEYFAAQNVDDACRLLSEYGEEAKVLAGGQSLMILLRQKLISPTYLIDIKGISDLDYIRYDESDGLRIGALTTHRTLEMSSVIREKFFMLAEMERRVASVQIRNWGTLGGNLCHADFASDLSPSLMALDAEVKLMSVAEERRVKLEAFFEDYYETVLRPGELLTEILIPPLPKGGGVYKKMTLRETDQGLAAVAAYAVVDSKDNEVCTDIRIVLGAAGPMPIRAKKAEQLINGVKVTDAIIEKAAQVASEESSPIPDIHASEDYKREMAKVLVKQVVKEAILRAKAALDQGRGDP